MTHHLRKHADVAAELVRILRDDLAAAMAGLDVPDRRECIHAVRQRLKWVRSILRVLKGTLGRETVDFRHQVADAARFLAGVRDAEVAAASARVLSAAPAGDRAEFGRLADHLDRQTESARRRRLPVGDARRRLVTVAEAASRFPTDFDGVALLNAAIVRAYRRGRRAMRLALATHAPADLHAWRKQAKHLGHLLRLARGSMPKRDPRLIGRLDQLAELLGLDHDHAILAEKLALASGDPSLGRQLALIATRRREMEDEAFALGKRIYSGKPKDFGRRHSITAAKG